MADGYGDKPRETLRKHEILRGHGAVEQVLSRGKRITGKYVNLFFLPDSERKVAFLAARKYRKAVQRNRIKRLLREVYRKHKFLFASGKWILYGKYQEPLPTYQQIKEDVVNLLETLRLDKEKDDK